MTQVGTGAKGMGSDSTAWSWAGSSANPAHRHFSSPLLEPHLSCLALCFALQGLGPAWEAVALPMARSSCHKAGCFGSSAQDLQAGGSALRSLPFVPLFVCGGSGRLCQRSFSVCWRALSSGADPARMLQTRHECAQFALCWRAWTPVSAPNSHKHPPEARVRIAPAALSPVL